jgi:AraC-like DNA-binding protein
LCAVAHQITGCDTATPEFSFSLLQGKEVKQSFLRMYSTMELSGSLLSQEESLLEFLYLLITRCSNTQPLKSRTGQERNAVSRVRCYIDEHFAGPISLAHLGSIAGLSPFHLHRIFTQQVGMPPHAYQTQVRINHAKDLLRQRISLSEIALSAGFADQSHLTRHFRRLVGVTPGRFS